MRVVRAFFCAGSAMAMKEWTKAHKNGKSCFERRR